MDNKIDCSIILDLLPLYHDNVVSENTKTAIEHHLENCESCKKEYELISENLPSVRENTTKEKFANMMKKQKQKRMISFVLAVILVCGFIGGGIYTLTVPCLVDVPQDEIDILRVYKYTDTDSPNNQDAFWVLGTRPVYDNSTILNAEFIVSEDGKSADLQYAMKVPVINKRSEDTPYTLLESNFTVYDEYKNIDTLTIDGKIVWVDGTTVPDYVYAKYSDDVTLWDYDAAQGTIRVEYKNGDFIHWDLDGNIVSKGNYHNHENE